jgi:PKD repeat protein
MTNLYPIKYPELPLNKPMCKLRTLLFRTIFVFIAAGIGQSFGQTCTIIASSNNVCAGTNVSFSVSITGGGTPVSYAWDFGDGFSGSTPLPGHNYLTAGTYTPTVTVTFSGGGTCNASGAQIKVSALPLSKYVITTEDSMCFRNNKLCIKDESVPGPSNAPIKRRLFQLSNGFILTENAPYSNTICYENNINLGGHLYTLVLEVTDTNNCTSRLEKTDSVVLFPRMQSISFNTNYIPTCFTTLVNFVNTSLLPPSVVKKFYWNFGDGGVDSTTWPGPSHLYTAPGAFLAKLYTVDINNCRDTAVAPDLIQNIIPDSTIYITQKNLCYKNNKFKFVSNNSGGTTFWTIYNNNNDIVHTAISNSPTDTIMHGFNTCGEFRVNMRVQFSNCSVETDTMVIAYGPDAIIQNDTDVVLNRTQCEVWDTVYFKTPVPYLSCQFSNASMEHLWDFNDPFAPPCTTDTRNGINAGINCNFSKDSMKVSHVYTPGQDRCYYPSLYMKDPILGCDDVDTISLGLTAPDAGWDSTIVPPRPGFVIVAPAKPCLNQSISFSLKETLPICGFENAWVNVDSACGKNNWIPVTDIKGRTFEHAYNSTCDTLDGYVTIGVIIKNGKDKFGNECYDTAWYHHMLKMTPIVPFFSMKVSASCNAVTVKITPDDSIQFNLKKVQWGYSITSWEDIESYLANSSQNINKSGSTQNFTLTDSVIHSIQLSDTLNGVYTFSSTLQNQEGCARSGFQAIGVGSFREFFRQKTVYCLEDSVEIEDFVRYYDANTADLLSLSQQWKDPLRAAANKEKLWWDMGDGRGFVLTGPKPKVKYDQPGRYTITMVSQDSIGCMDTLVKNRLYRSGRA